MFSAVLWPFKWFRLALLFHNIVVVNVVANYGRLCMGNIFMYSMVSKYFTVRLICKTKFPNSCHAVINNSAVKGF